MSKNNKLINSLNEVARRNRSRNIGYAAETVIPQLYAALALALHRKYGFGYRRINDVFVESQNIWEEFTGNGDDMIKMCEEETGVNTLSTGSDNKGD